MSRVRRAVSIALFVATFGTMGAAILGVIDPLFMLIAWAALLADSLLAIDRHHRRLNRPAPAKPPRPDADVAQYLNDEDRKWLGEFAPDWTDPRPALAPSCGNAQRDLDRIDRQPARPLRPAVLTPKDCAVSAIAPLSAQVYVAPGPLTPEAWPTISPTSSAGGRTDLVIVRVEDPNAPETGTWAEPADPGARALRVRPGHRGRPPRDVERRPGQQRLECNHSGPHRPARLDGLRSSGSHHRPANAHRPASGSPAGRARLRPADRRAQDRGRRVRHDRDSRVVHRPRRPPGVHRQVAIQRFHRYVAVMELR